MYSRIWMINALLVLLAAFLGLKAYGVWSQENWSDPESGTGKRVRIKSPERPVERLFKRKAPPESGYSVVVDKNLFSAKRSEAQPAKVKQKGTDDGGTSVSSEQALLFLKRIMLYGVVITDNYAAALVTNIGKMTAPPQGRRARQKIDKRQPQGRLPGQGVGGRQTKWVKSGDTLGDFKVAEIMDERVVLKIGSQSYDLFLYDKDKPKPRAAMAARLNPTVVNTAGTGAPPVTKTPKRRLPQAKTPNKGAVLSPTKQALRTRALIEKRNLERIR